MRSLVNARSLPAGRLVATRGRLWRVRPPPSGAGGVDTVVMGVGAPVPKTVELFPPLQTRMRSETDDLRERMCMPECRKRMTNPCLLQSVSGRGSVRQTA